MKTTKVTKTKTSSISKVSKKEEQNVAVSAQRDIVHKHHVLKPIKFTPNEPEKLLKLRGYNEGPPGGWRYVEEKTGVTIKANTWKTLVSNVVNFLETHGSQVPADIAARIEHQLASNLPDEWRAK